MGLGDWLTAGKVLVGIAHGGRAFTGPYQASIALTYRCNLRCIHCYFYSPLLPEPNYFDVRAARAGNGEAPARAGRAAVRGLDTDVRRTEALIDDLVAMGTRSFHFAGAGEPLMHPQALEFFARIKRAGCATCMNTNGTPIDRERAEALVEMGFDELRVTTMAGGEEAYARTHPGSPPGTFGRLRESLLAIAECKGARGVSRPAVNLVFVVVQHNCEGLSDFVRFAEEVRADGVMVVPVDDINDPAMAPLVPTEAQADAVHAQMPELTRFLEARGIRHNLKRFAMTFRSRLDTRALYRVIPCYMGWLSLRVFPEGTVYPCCRCYGPLGNVQEQRTRDIWHGAAYNEFRRAARRINRRGSPVQGCACDNCANTGPNLRMFRLLHPLSGRLRALERERASFEGQPE